MNLKDCKLFVTAQNGGGEGKSTKTDAFVTLASMAGFNPVVFDADPGLRGFKNRAGKEGTIELPWEKSLSAGEDGVTWCTEHFAKHQMIVIDTGANFFSATQRVKEFLFEVIEGALELGVEVTFYALVGTNKAGSFNGAVELHSRFGHHVDVVLVRNNRDGSKNFGEGKLSPNWSATIDIEHLSPGLQAYRLTRAEPLLGIVREPTPGYSLASAMIAKWLYRIARQPHVRSIFPESVISELEELSTPAPHAFSYTLTTLESVKDESLSANAEVHRASRAFLDASPDAEEAAFHQAANALWHAENAYRKV